MRVQWACKPLLRLEGEDETGDTSVNSSLDAGTQGTCHSDTRTHVSQKRQGKAAIHTLLALNVGKFSLYTLASALKGNIYLRTALKLFKKAKLH